MGNKITSHTLIEHGFIYVGEGKEGHNVGVKQKDFDAIKKYILKNGKEEDNAITNFLVPGYNNICGEILKAKNYVGVLQTKKGVTIEILPKIYGINEDNEKTKKIFLNMLRTLRDSSFKKSSFANLDLSRMSLLDIFINMFLDELEKLVKQGLRKSYLHIYESRHTLKGKIDFNQNIRHNLVHKERFFVGYDQFSSDRPENRLIKSTLLNIQKKASTNRIQQRVRKYCFIFDEISCSENVDNDILRCKSNRLTSHYDQILIWCRIFLKNKTFQSYKGNDLAFALLFPMEKIFEDYIAYCLRKESKIIHFQTQKIIGHLLKSGKYKMKPDIVIDNGKIIADTKWKILDEKHMMSQNDLYQMYAYATKRDTKDFNQSQRIILIYPMNEEVTETKEYFFNDNIRLTVFPFDLNNEKESLNRIRMNIGEIMEVKHFTKSLFSLALSCPTKLYYHANKAYNNQSSEDTFS